MEFTIEQLKTFSPEITQMLNKLLTQLNPGSEKLSDKDIGEIVGESSSHLLVARETVSDKIVGMLTLVVYHIPVGKKGWIEDLVVDKEYRNRGIATKLINNAVEKAKADRVLSLNFTSRPEREKANKLYEKLGFMKRDTNIYRIEL